MAESPNHDHLQTASCHSNSSLQRLSLLARDTPYPLLFHPQLQVPTNFAYLSKLFSKNPSIEPKTRL